MTAIIIAFLNKYRFGSNKCILKIVFIHALYRTAYKMITDNNNLTYDLLINIKKNNTNQIL